MEKLPVLSKDQLKRLHHFMEQSGYVASLSAARKITQGPIKVKKVVEDMYSNFDDSSHGSLEDIYDLYLQPDDLNLESKPIDNKVNRSVRGKGKKENMVLYPVRLEIEQLDNLKQIPGQVSKHIRTAIDVYLESKQIYKKTKGGDDE
jgi:hypothetical protein